MHEDKRDELEKQKEFRKEASDLKKKRKAAEKKAKKKKKKKEIEKLSGKFEKYENETQASAIMTTLPMVFISLIYLDCQNKNRNKHEQEFNRMMERACAELSRSNIKLKDERLLRMKYVTPP
jgi:hypothetical protein